MSTLQQAVADWSPERVSATTGIDAERIRGLARELAGTPRAVVYGRIGTCNQEFGSLASWLVDVVNIVTGHFDTPAAAMFARPTAWTITSQPIPGLEDGAPNFGRYRTRVRGAKEVLGQVPVSCMLEEITTPGEGQLKALITVAGNPVLSTPGGDKLDEALPQLDAMISVDLWLNETTRHADVILPGASALEQPHSADSAAGCGDQQLRPVLTAGVPPRGSRCTGGMGDSGSGSLAVHGHPGRGCRHRRAR